MEKLYEGKSKVVYSSEEPGTCIIKYKDTATAGNGVKKMCIRDRLYSMLSKITSR